MARAIKQIPKTDLENAQRENAALRKMLKTQTVLLQRQRLAAALGQQFSGERELYTVLGYKLEPTYLDYEAKYLRQDVAGRVVDLPAQDTWRQPPQVWDGDNDESAFVDAVKAFAQRLRLWHYLERADRLAGIGHYGVLLLGIRDGGEFEQPVRAESISGPESILYLSAFDQGSADVESLIQDADDPRFGQPEYYSLDIGSTVSGERVETKRVHYTRVLHIAEGLLEDEVYGRPRLERIYNRLDDMDKVVGSSAEAYWKLVYQGMILTAKDDYTLEQAGIDQDELDEYVHGLRRVLELEGIDVTIPEPSIVNPKPVFEMLIGLIAGETGIPQRMLLGSERGELASTQDGANWAGVIASRRENYAEPQMLRPLFDRLIQWGALPEPQSGEYSFTWKPIFELTELEQAELALKASTAIKNVSPTGAPDLVIDGKRFIEILLPDLTDAAVDVGEELDREAEDQDDVEPEDSLGFFSDLRTRANTGIPRS